MPPIEFEKAVEIDPDYEGGSSKPGAGTGTDGDGKEGEPVTAKN